MASRHAQRGFGLGMHGSWFETFGMPLVIIAVLAAIAVPSYFEYRARARIAEAIASSAGARAAIEKAFAARGPADMSLPETTGWSAPRSEGLQSIRIARGGAITLRFDAGAISAEPGRVQVQIVPLAGGAPIDLSAPASRGRSFEWKCGGAAGATTVEAKLLPESCR